MSLKKNVAENLLNIEAVKVKMDPPFTWVSGIKSPVYCDNRKLISYPEERKIVVNGFKQILNEKGLNPGVIGGTATAAIPWAAFLAYELDLPMIYIRPEKKEHGAGKQIEGNLEEGKEVLIIEDLISTGGSSIKAVEAVREAGGRVNDVFAIVTWELEGVLEKFDDVSVRLATLTNFTNLIGLARERGDITSDQYDIVMDFKKDPKVWGDNYGF